MTLWGWRTLQPGPDRFRIEYPGAFYHVMHRGNAGADKFEGEYYKKRRKIRMRLYGRILIINYSHWLFD